MVFGQYQEADFVANIYYKKIQKAIDDENKLVKAGGQAWI